MASSTNNFTTSFNHEAGLAASATDWVSDSITFYFMTTLAVLAMLHVASFWLCTCEAIIPQKLRTMCCVTLSDHIVGLVYYPILAFLACGATLELYSKNSVEARWALTTPFSSMYTVLFVAENLVHIPVVIFRQQSRSLKYQILAHHFVTCWWYTYGLRTCKMEFFGTLAGCAEVTNVFLGQVMLLKEFGRPGSIWLLVNGVLLWLSFVVFRLFLLPVCLYMWYTDISQFPEQTLHVNEGFYAIIYFPGTLMVWVLSCVWFASITRGMLSAVRKTIVPSE